MSFNRTYDRGYPTTYGSSYRSFTNNILPSRSFDSTSTMDRYNAFSSTVPSRSSSLRIAQTPRAAPLPISRPIASRDYQHIFTQIAKINDHLYLSSLNAISLDRLKDLGITLVVTAINEPPPLRYVSDIATLHVPVEDIEYANLRPYFDRVADRILAEYRRGGKTLVHCMAGISRSTSLILAYLMKHKNMTLKDSFEYTKARRPYVFPNMGFWRQLIEYEQSIRRGQPSSVKMVATDRGMLPDVVVDAINGGTRSMTARSRSSSPATYRSNSYLTSGSVSSNTVIGTSAPLRSFTYRPNYARY